jgi:hypothetical protein
MGYAPCDLQNYTGQGLTTRAAAKASTISDAAIASSLGNLGTTNTAASSNTATQPKSDKVAIIVGCTVGIGMAAVLAVVAVVIVQQRKATAARASGVYPGGDVAAPLTADSYAGGPVAEGCERHASRLGSFYSRKAAATLQG